jgi:hypothetical protein
LEHAAVSNLKTCAGSHPYESVVGDVDVLQHDLLEWAESCLGMPAHGSSRRTTVHPGRERQAARRIDAVPPFQIGESGRSRGKTSGGEPSDNLGPTWPRLLQRLLGSLARLFVQGKNIVSSSPSRPAQFQQGCPCRLLYAAAAHFSRLNQFDQQ